MNDGFKRRDGGRSDSCRDFNSLDRSFGLARLFVVYLGSACSDLGNNVIQVKPIYFFSFFFFETNV